MAEAFQTVAANIKQRIDFVTADHMSATLIHDSTLWAIEAANILLALIASHNYLFTFFANIDSCIPKERSQNIIYILTTKAVIEKDAILTVR